VVTVHRPAGETAIRFFLLASGLLILAGVIAFSLVSLFPPHVPGGEPLFPPAFAVSTACLLAGSWALSCASIYVRHERQIPFRRALRAATGFGTAFLAVQTFALAVFCRQQIPEQAATSATAFVAVAVALHGMHFLVAWLFVVYVTLQAHAERYDHEYYQPVVFCAWFWHALGIVWFTVLCVMAIANQGILDDGVTPDPAPSAFIIPFTPPRSLAVSHARADKLH
jgi:heme/copper-type cytochrome/quinol oxidase subunit 3